MSAQARIELDRLRRSVEEMAERIGLQSEHLPTFGFSDQFARPAVLFDGDWHYVIAERGQEYSRVTTKAEDEILFLLFRDATSFAASDYELAHRIEGQDHRRIKFERQVELLGRLDIRWAARVSAEIADILSRWPYDDRGATDVEERPARAGPRRWLPLFAVAFNGAAACACAVLLASAPSRAGSLLAAGGCLFFGAAASAFAAMARLRAAALTKSRDAATEPHAR